MDTQNHACFDLHQSWMRPNGTRKTHPWHLDGLNTNCKADFGSRGIVKGGHALLWLSMDVTVHTNTKLVLVKPH